LVKVHVGTDLDWNIVAEEAFTSRVFYHQSDEGVDMISMPFAPEVRWLRFISESGFLIGIY
jgi:hypothetical protein